MGRTMRSTVGFWLFALFLVVAPSIAFNPFNFFRGAANEDSGDRSRSDDETHSFFEHSDFGSNNTLLVIALIHL